MSVLKDKNAFIPNSLSAWVVFSGHTDISWLKFLKAGFQHCFILLNDGRRWMSIDPLSPYTDIQIYHHISPDFDLPSWLEVQGDKVVYANIKRNHKKAAPCMVFTCVESIKRILGIHKRFIITPWQLCKFLEKSQDKKKQNNRKELSHG